MSPVKRNFLKGLLNGISVAIGVLLTVDVMAGAAITHNVLLGAGLTGLAAAITDWKTALNARQPSATR